MNDGKDKLQGGRAVQKTSNKLHLRHQVKEPNFQSKNPLAEQVIEHLHYLYVVSPNQEALQIRGQGAHE